jgi:anti-anti-sigma factor
VRDPLAQLTFEAQGDVLVGCVEGEIDSANAGELRDALSRRLTNSGPGLILDLSEATYLDSAGIEFLFDLARRLRTHSQRLRLVVPANAPMRRVLDLCGIEQVTPVDVTVDAAIEGMRDQAT